MTSLSWEDLERLRDPIYQRTPALRVRTIADAEQFVNRNGLVFAFKARNSELPCLWHAACGARHPVMPEHTHHDPGISLVWRAKDVLPAKKKIYYGKALKKTPTMISLSLFAAFYAAMGCTVRGDYMNLSSQGKLTRLARRIMDVLRDSPPLATAELKLATGHDGPSRRSAFDRAIAELQGHLLIVKIAESYDPFSFIWGRLDRWLEEEVRSARAFSMVEGRTAVLTTYFSRVVASTPDRAARLFGWAPADVQALFDRLEGDGTISAAVELRDARGTWYIHSDFV
jgi:hypothetical protein